MMQQAGEPSVEEILESIKKVIAREPLPLNGQTASRRSFAEPPEPAGPEEAEDMLELDDEAAMSLSAQEDEAGDRYAEAQATGGEDAGDAPLTGAATAAAMRDNLAALAMMAQPGRSPQIVRSGETSLEGLTRDLLRPMLAQWLDTHLPAMVEELVKAEIARIAGKGR